MQAIIVRDKDLDSERQCHAIHASRKWRVVRGDPFITFAERGRGGGYPKANLVSEVA